MICLYPRYNLLRIVRWRSGILFFVRKCFCPEAEGQLNEIPISTLLNALITISMSLRPWHRKLTRFISNSSNVYTPYNLKDVGCKLGEFLFVEKFKLRVSKRKFMKAIMVGDLSSKVHVSCAIFSALIFISAEFRGKSLYLVYRHPGFCDATGDAKVRILPPRLIYFFTFNTC